MDFFVKLFFRRFNLNPMRTEPELISGPDKWRLWFAAWGVVTLVSAVPHPTQLIFAPFFPVGFLALLPRGENDAIAGLLLIVPAIIGWCLYFLLTGLLMQIRRINRFLLVYAIFCAVLVFNVVGCKKMLAGVAAIR